MNTFGSIFRLTSFGESHGPAIGGIIDGMPAGLTVDIEAVQAELERRRPGLSEIATSRREDDRLEILSGLYDGITTGTPIGFIIRNTDCRPGDYDKLKDTFRPSHADYTYSAKYGLRDWRGGGRSSARETATRVVAGAFARQALARFGIKIHAYTSQIGDIRLDKTYDKVVMADTYSNPVRCPDRDAAARMEAELRSLDGDTLGGTVTGVISGVPAGLGEPVYGKFQACLAAAMMSINAAKGFEYGMGFDGAARRGTEVLDEFCISPDGSVTTRTNHSGGIQGGITNGRNIYFNVAFKPVATTLRPVATVTADGREVMLEAKGRHDPCVVPRAVPVVEAMAAIVTFDAILQNRSARI